jgi:predicted metal-binding membrane protein
MAMLFPIGMMNIAALATVTAFIYVEKVLPVGRTVGRAAGVGLIALGLAVIVHPALLPDSLAHHTMPAGMHMDRG